MARYVNEAGDEYESPRFTVDDGELDDAYPAFIYDHKLQRIIEWGTRADCAQFAAAMNQEEIS